MLLLFFYTCIDICACLYQVCFEKHFQPGLPSKIRELNLRKSTVNSLLEETVWISKKLLPKKSACLVKSQRGYRATLGAHCNFILTSKHSVNISDLFYFFDNFVFDAKIFKHCFNHHVCIFKILQMTNKNYKEKVFNQKAAEC